MNRIAIRLECACGAAAGFYNATQARRSGWIVGDVIRCPACPAPELGQVKGEVPDPPSMLAPPDEWRE